MSPCSLIGSPLSKIPSNKIWREENHGPALLTASSKSFTTVRAEYPRQKGGSSSPLRSPHAAQGGNASLHLERPSLLLRRRARGKESTEADRERRRLSKAGEREGRKRGFPSCSVASCWPLLREKLCCGRCCMATQSLEEDNSEDLGSKHP